MRIIIAALAALTLVGCEETFEDKQAREEAELHEKAKAAAASLLKDPMSAQFRNVTGNTAVCGEVNGKNSFGAYSGFKPFYYFEMGDPPVDVSTDDYSAAHALQCDLAGSDRAKRKALGCSNRDRDTEFWLFYGIYCGKSFANP